MKIINPTSKHHMYAAWLKSELFRMKTDLTPEQIKLIEQPNFDNPDENEQRKLADLSDGEKAIISLSFALIFSSKSNFSISSL